LFGGHLGLPLLLGTLVPMDPPIDWESALFGELGEESEQLLI
jgi:hypothetical protein